MFQPTQRDTGAGADVGDDHSTSVQVMANVRRDGGPVDGLAKVEAANAGVTGIAAVHAFELDARPYGVVADVTARGPASVRIDGRKTTTEARHLAETFPWVSQVRVQRRHCWSRYISLATILIVISYEFPAT
jgi:hypothetical protein